MVPGRSQLRQRQQDRQHITYTVTSGRLYQFCQLPDHCQYCTHGCERISQWNSWFEDYDNMFRWFCYPGTTQGPVTGFGNVSATNSVRGTFQNSDTLVPLDRTVNITLPPGITWANVVNITVTVNVDHQRDQEVEMYLIAPDSSGQCAQFIRNTPSPPYPAYSQVL